MVAVCWLNWALHLMAKTTKIMHSSWAIWAQPDLPLDLLLYWRQYAKLLIVKPRLVVYVFCCIYDIFLKVCGFYVKMLFINH